MTCFSMKLSASNKDTLSNNTDTLKVNYTYWWPSGGPFIGLCGDEYSLVFTGTITRLNKPSGPFKSHDKTITLYTPQTGVVKINEVKFKKAPGECSKDTTGHEYNGEAYFSSDCFNESRLKEGDKVIVFIYSYEGEYSIPGNSVLRINNFDDSIVKSVDKYIKNNQDPLSIKDDLIIWSKYGLDKTLKKIIECRQTNMK